MKNIITHGADKKRNMKKFVDEVVNKINEGVCDLFIGSGISASSGLSV